MYIYLYLTIVRLRDDVMFITTRDCVHTTHVVCLRTEATVTIETLFRPYSSSIQSSMVLAVVPLSFEPHLHLPPHRPLNAFGKAWVDLAANNQTITQR